ncbi:MAG: S46 family peptidase, partial [Myxococcota bacterium]
FQQTKLVGDPTLSETIKPAAVLRRAMFQAKRVEIESSKDPLLQLAVRLVKETKALNNGPLAPVRHVLGPVLKTQLVTQVLKPKYWDANFTLRFNYGTVQDYTDSKTNKTHRYISTLSELIAKDKGKEPFLAPKKLKRVFAKKAFGPWVDKNIKDVPINFTATLDTTGGNSGSPVVDGKGRLIGLLFDGTPEAILSDWQYLEKQQRSICVDIRFALFLADKVDDAKRVLQELGIK